MKIEFEYFYKSHTVLEFAGQKILQDKMKKILKFLGYGFLLVLVIFQIIGILFSPSLKESLVRLFVVFCVAIFFCHQVAEEAQENRDHR